MGFGNLTFAGGRDTIIHSISSIIAYLGNNPEALEFLRQDPRRIVHAGEEFFRVFMVPGMQHCSGGPGPNTFDMLTALENWVEQGEAPKSVIASHLTSGVVDRTRPLCSYPQVARYRGTGSIDDAGSFTCAAAADATSRKTTSVDQ